MHSIRIDYFPRLILRTDFDNRSDVQFRILAAISSNLAPVQSQLRKKQLRFHESTQRALCRMAFFWLALMPVLAVASYSLIRITPWYISNEKIAWQRRLSENLGVDVQFKSIEFPSPNQFRAYDLICCNPETGREILTVSQVNATMDRGGWMVEVGKPVLNGMQIQTAIQALHDRLLCRPQSSASLLGITMSELLVSGGSRKTKLQDVKVALSPTETSSILRVTYSLEGQKFAAPAMFTANREHVSETTRWSLKSGEFLIPCQLLSERFPALEHLGSQATFRGSIDWWQKNHRWETSVRGEFQSVDLGSLSEPFGRPLEGVGQLILLNSGISDGQVRQLEGSLSSSKCIADSSWLDDTYDNGNLQTMDDRPWRENGLHAAMNRLAIGFAMEASGLVLKGNTPPPRPETPDQQWPMLAAYANNKPIAFSPSTIIPLQTFSTALASLLKPTAEPEPARVADGRR